jgi:transglutaminase-like putative cysteine protease
MAATVIKLAKPLEHPHSAESITYKASLGEGEIEGAFVPGPTQEIKLLDKHTCELTVRRVRPDEPKKLDKPDMPPVAADVAPNPLVQSDDKKVVELANSVAKDQDDPWQVAVALEGMVYKLIKTKNFSQTFLSAAEVAKAREGDCTEHAVLLAAVCRARQIPARGAMGLVYYVDRDTKTPSFAYHMWTEVWIKDRWIPLDATLGQGGIGAGHIKVAHSNLDGADALSAFLPVFKVLGQLKLEVLQEK